MRRVFGDNMVKPVADALAQNSLIGTSSFEGNFRVFCVKNGQRNTSTCNTGKIQSYYLNYCDETVWVGRFAMSCNRLVFQNEKVTESLIFILFIKKYIEINTGIFVKSLFFQELVEYDNTRNNVKMRPNFYNF